MSLTDADHAEPGPSLGRDLPEEYPRMIDSYPTFQEPEEGGFYTINRLAESRFPVMEAIIGGNTYCTDKPPLALRRGASQAG